MTHETSFWSLIANASLIVQLIMLALAMISLGSWWVIVKKYLVLASARRAGDQFEDDFWSGIDLASLYARINRQKEPVWGMDAIFLAGFQEFLRLRAQPTMDPESVVSGAQRAMRAAGSRELDELDMYLPLLATAGSTSPYIGLFGTVWGHHERLHGAGYDPAGDPGAGRAGHRRGVDRDRHGPVRRDSRGDFLQPLCA